MREERLPARSDEMRKSFGNATRWLAPNLTLRQRQLELERRGAAAEDGPREWLIARSTPRETTLGAAAIEGVRSELRATSTTPPTYFEEAA
jgi:hypothetical protein